jgi:DUF1680 family protein
MIALVASLALLSPTMAGLSEVPFQAVRVHDTFWDPWRDRNRKLSIPHALENLETYGNLKNFDLAAAGQHTGFQGPVFMDSDAYKVIEAAAYCLASDKDPKLDKAIDGVIARIAKAQQPDGYLDTYYIVNGLSRRLTNLEDNHELYCAGHLFEAAAAHFQATGKRNLLNVATRYADFLVKTFGDGPGHRAGYPGHPEIELALVRLAGVTGNKSYFDLARFFVDHRGTHFFAVEHNRPEAQYDGTYWLDNVPIRSLGKIEGHAVRAGYLMSGATDVAAQTGDPGLLSMLNRVWQNTVQKNMYVTGGIGPSASNEGFTEDYDLPNLSAYQETCASVALLMWNHRLNLLYGDAKYADLVETSLYNGVLAGVSLDGTHFFYVNPLASMGTHHRSGWFSCACCPPNAARTISGLGRYAYATKGNDIYVNLYFGNDATVTTGSGPVKLTQTTSYPWSGRVDLTVDPSAAAQMNLKLRIPGWCDPSKVSLSVDGRSVPVALEKGYAVLTGRFTGGTKVRLELPMEPRRIAANPNVKDDVGKLALARGPIIYAVEQVDVKAPLSGVSLPASAPVTERWEPKLLGGVQALEATGLSSPVEWTAKLYGAAPAPTPVKLRAVPYYAWDNRAPGPMEVWLPVSPPPPPAGGPERQARVTLSHTSGNAQPDGVNNGEEPRSSGEQPGRLCHFWPRKGTEEWVQYKWQAPQTISGARVYWFDDTGRGECRLPTSWTLEYLDGETWKPVSLLSGEGYKIAADRWCEVSFSKVKTSALRLRLQMQTGWAAGVRQWRVETDAEEN